MIFDEIITGFRWSLGGAQAHYGVTPDLACFGKAMGNGMPIAAVVGRADIMRLMEDIFFSGTFGGEALSIAAAIATIDKMEREDVTGCLWQVGGELMSAARAKIAAAGLGEVVKLVGAPPWAILAYRDHAKASKEAIKTLLPARTDRGGRADQRQPQSLLRAHAGRPRAGAGGLRSRARGAARRARPWRHRPSPRQSGDPADFHGAGGVVVNAAAEGFE